jgi:hypothetical protein
MLPEPLEAMMRIRISAIVLFGTLAGCAGAPRTAPVQLGPVATGAGTVESARRYLEGRWDLISYDLAPAGAPRIHLADASGTLIYDAYGNLEMQVRVPDDVAAEFTRSGVPVKNGMISTTGRAALDLQSRTLTYFPEGQPPLLSGAPAGPLATSRPRNWSLEGDDLVLTIKGDDGEPVSVSRWRKTTP